MLSDQGSRLWPVHLDELYDFLAPNAAKCTILRRKYHGQQANRDNLELPPDRILVWLPETSLGAHFSPCWAPS